MTCLNRTDLTTPQKVQCSIQALLAQLHGGMSVLSQKVNLSRPTLYATAATTQQLLEQHFSQGSTPLTPLVIDEAQLRRAVVALRIVAPNSIRAIEELIPLLYPGQSMSFGKIQTWLIEAQDKAAQLNAQADLSKIRAGALDELFSQGDPVLAGIDLDSGYLFNLAVCTTRAGEDWAQVLGIAQDQGLNLQVVVKDAAKGIASGVSTVFPQAQQRDDSFHALYELGKVRRWMEQKAYAAISAEQAALKQLGKIRVKDKPARRKGYQQLSKAQQRCIQRIDDYDQFETAVQQVTQALEWVNLHTGQWQNAQRMQNEIQHAAETIRQLPYDKCRSLATYLSNRAPGLALYADELDQQLQPLVASYSHKAVSLACTLVQLRHYLQETPLSDKQQQHFQQHCLGAWYMLQQQCSESAVQSLLDAVQAMWQQRHRASSAIEGFNSRLRPFLYVQKCAQQGFLDLFRAYFNLRQRRSGRHKGSSAHEKLTGKPTKDWLSVLGYPPSVIHQA